MFLAKLNRLLLPLIFLAILGVAPVANAYYDPGIQRWINRDPLGERGFVIIKHQKSSINGRGPNQYAFTSGNPISRVDGFGLKDKGWQWRNRIGCMAAVTGWYRCALKRAEQEFEDCLDTCQGIKDDDERESCIANCVDLHAASAKMAATKAGIMYGVCIANVLLDFEVDY